MLIPNHHDTREKTGYPGHFAMGGAIINNDDLRRDARMGHH